MSSITSSLRRLPLRGLVAVATRSARRFHPLFATWAVENGLETEVESLVRLTDWTEHFIRDAKPICVEDQRIEQSANHANEVAFNSGDERAIRSSFATLAAYECALSCFNFSKSQSGVQLENAIETAESAVITNDYFDYSSFQSDVERLCELRLGEFPSLGQSFDPSEAGPMGALWTGLRPSWYRAGSDVIDSYV